MSGSFSSRFLWCLAYVILLFVQVHALNNGVGRTPPMGWNDWNQFGVAPRTIYTVLADSFVSLGLRDVGYVYLNRDGGTPRPENSTFVSTYKPIADYIHAKGMKFGCYLQLSPATDAEAQQYAKAMADAGVDYLKHDAWTTNPTDASWKRMSQAMLATNRPFFYSTHKNYDSTVCHMFRTGPDVDPNWTSVMYDYDANYTTLSMAKPGFWPDPDMLEVGVATEDGKLTEDENVSHFSMWCMMASPLLASYDFSRTISGEKLQNAGDAYSDVNFVKIVRIHANAELIAVDQDSLGKPGRRLRGQGALEVWVKDLRDGTKAVALFNRTVATADMSISQADLGWSGAQQVYARDLWLHENVAPFSGTMTQSVRSHAVKVYRMSDKPIGEPTAILKKMDRNISWLRKNGYDLFPQRLVPSILAVKSTDTRIFDLRGRAVAVNPVILPTSILVTRGQESGQSHRLVWRR